MTARIMIAIISLAGLVIIAQKLRDVKTSTYDVRRLHEAQMRLCMEQCEGDVECECACVDSLNFTTKNRSK